MKVSAAERHRNGIQGGSVKSPIPALEGLLITAGKDVKVTGYDLKKAYIRFWEADVEEPGSVVLGCPSFGRDDPPHAGRHNNHFRKKTAGDNR